MSNILLETSIELAVDVVHLCKKMKNDFTTQPTINQILRSSSSIMANIAESNGAESKTDMRHKLSISLKEAFETVAWLELLLRCNHISKEDFESLLATTNYIIAMLKKSIKTLTYKIKSESKPKKKI